jgi:hypothetical protein
MGLGQMTVTRAGSDQLPVSQVGVRHVAPDPRASQRVLVAGLPLAEFGDAPARPAAPAAYYEAGSRPAPGPSSRGSGAVSAPVSAVPPGPAQPDDRAGQPELAVRTPGLFRSRPSCLSREDTGCRLLALPCARQACFRAVSSRYSQSITVVSVPRSWRRARSASSWSSAAVRAGSAAMFRYAAMVGP